MMPAEQDNKSSCQPVGSAPDVAGKPKTQSSLEQVGSNSPDGMTGNPKGSFDEPLGSLSDLYLSESGGPLEPGNDSNRNSPSTGAVMSERVQRIASGIYTEFEAMIEAYGLPVVERLMPLVVGALENLDELYKDQTAYHAEVDQLREQNSFMAGELEREKQRRKQSEMRLLQTEDTFEEERKNSEAKIEALSTSCRQAELKYKNAQDQVSRFEAKESEWKKESTRLHDRINELIRSNVELTDQVKFSSRPTEQAIPREGSTRLGSSDNRSRSVIENIYDRTSGGFGFDEMPSADVVEPIPAEDDIPAGMRKEIDILIKENMELVETKNALNVVKDDLIAKIDALTSENISLQESVSLLTKARSSLQSELTSTDQLLNDARAELDELKERISNATHKAEDSAGSMHRKRFTRAEMARVLSERNQYKERLMELQEAVRLTETLRAGQKGHPELLLGLGPGGNQLTTGSSQMSNSQQPVRPLQSLQNFFAVLLSAHRPDIAGDKSGIPLSPLSRFSSPHSSAVSQSWVRLSRKRTEAPIYGWSRGVDSSSPKTSASPSPETAKNQPTGESVPVPIQCRTIGGSHGVYLEIAAALTVSVTTNDEDSSLKSHIWLIGRGPRESGPSMSPGKSTRSYVGQVHIFEPNHFSQPICCFDLADGFLPTTAVFVSNVKASEMHFGSASSEKTETSDQAETVELRWNFPRSTAEKLHRRSAEPFSCVMLASNDGRFLILRVQTPRELQPCTTQPMRQDELIWAQCRVQNASLVANYMISWRQTVCLSLSNPSGISQLACFDFSSMEFRQVPKDTGISAQTTHALISFPGNNDATGPVVMTAEPTTGFIWLGTAGGGHCHCFDLNAMKATVCLNLPPETPCLHAIEVQDAPGCTARIVWLAVSGGPTTRDGDGNPPVKNDRSKGMARLLAFRSDQCAIIRQIDLTGSLSSMLDTEHVTDPLDLTLCRLLLVSNARDQTMWFATRCGIIGRLPLSKTDLSRAPNGIDVPRPSAVSLSCHAYRRPVCNMIPVKIPKPGTAEFEWLVIGVGHDYVNLRPQQRDSPVHSQSAIEPDNALTDAATIRSRQLISGAHAIVWKLASGAF
ncbi:unnamed protein product [Calicophoron daubneyi]|uniref:Uncharacterized protein n=1 Tax=Calicophoron daubneyi TaxID=300641 RepID=A0AAV2TFI2_CALDB